MNRRGSVLLFLGVLVFIGLSNSLKFYGEEVHSIETRGSVSFTGTWIEQKTTPPPPDGVVRPGKMPQLNEETNYWSTLGILIIVFVTIFKCNEIFILKQKELLTMRSIRLISAVALTGAILLGGQAVFAATTVTQSSNGTVRFIPNTTELPEVVPPVTEPEVTIPPMNTDPLSIIYVPTMDFGTQENSINDKTYSMLAEMQTPTTGGAEVPYVSFAQVWDGTGENTGWTLSVTASDFMNESTQHTTLTGAEISLAGSKIAYSGLPAESPTAIATDFTLTPNNQVNLMTAAFGNGSRSSSIIWGEQTNIEADVNESNKHLNNAITLFVPGATIKDSTLYTATLDWSLTNVPTN